MITLPSVIVSAPLTAINGINEATMQRPRVLLADDHRLLCEAFQRLLEGRCEVVGSVADGRALVAAALQMRPDIVIVDIGMPLLNGLEASRQLKRLMPELKVIVLTMNEDRDVAAEAFRAGVSGYLLKNSAASELLQAIDEVWQGRFYVTPLAASGLLEALTHDSASRRLASNLSGRQREVLQLLAEGHTMKQVAHLLKITPRTVAFHKYAMMESLGIKTTADLIQYAVAQHIVPGSPTL
jgi:DNA-binding NarL/FixJ family response regulator